MVGITCYLIYENEGVISPFLGAILKLVAIVYLLGSEEELSLVNAL